jgi:hypothetical protein
MISIGKILSKLRMLLEGVDLTKNCVYQETTELRERQSSRLIASNECKLVGSIKERPVKRQ